MTCPEMAAVWRTIGFNMTTVYFLCGLAASGKTTYAKQLEAEIGAVRLTLDARMIAKCDYSIFDEEYGRLVAEEKEQMWVEAQEYLAHGRDVVLDWSLWSRQARQHWTERVVTAGYTYKLIYLEASLDLLRQRVTTRNAQKTEQTHHIPVAELERFSKIFEPPTAHENLNLEIVHIAANTEQC